MILISSVKRQNFIHPCQNIKTWQVSLVGFADVKLISVITCGLSRFSIE